MYKLIKKIVGISILPFFPFVLVYDMGIVIALDDKYNFNESLNFVWKEWKELFWK